ncbi:hypothetical protein F3S07_22440 [Vibrio alginolyticus]|jgi:hypothetical protein|uniref:capsular polysaccharide export protein, LipB/KpsS family n=3 Tax=Vibrionaceae TaxID=641 RepID=UPI0014833240|nr:MULTISPECIES: hypothetical protein [unclassified Vibrio]EGQ9575915.1 hypothetical protein [Vibrio alginolyticus]EGR2355896.1 hypothetical protein [Vibrio alginolyticus]EIL8372293.1 hypothetical protein [Vibrio alginolyticus]ELA8259786.1 hypothetical protein [Vibrio alginolyticus]MDW1799667.1 hypothetical protein [Vibrio sp. Vb2201]
MLRAAFKLISPLLPSKINIKLITFCTRLGFGGKYLFKYYIKNAEVKNYVIENYFFDRYPELSGCGLDKKGTDKVSNEARKISSSSGNGSTNYTNSKLDSIFESMSTSFENNDHDSAMGFYNVLVSRHFNTAQAQKAIIERSKDASFYKANKDVVHKAICNLIDSRKGNKFLLQYFKFKLSSGLNDELLSLTEFFYYKNHTNQGVITFLGDIYKNDGKYLNALNYYSALKGVNYHYGSAKLISLHADEDNINDLHEELCSLLDSKVPNKEAFRIVPMLLRVAPLLKGEEFTSTKMRIFELRDKFCSSFKEATLNEARSRAVVRSRYLPFFDKLSDSVKSDLGYSLTNSEVSRNIFHLAYYNDSQDNIACVDKGDVKYLSLEEANERNDIFELFIPTVFFNLDTTKDIYGSIRTFYVNLLEVLWDGNYAFIPRMQYNWRDVDLKSTSDVVCYHSVLGDREGNNVVVQESTLSGRVSLDSKGYAGFSAFSSLDIPNDTTCIDESLILSFIENFKAQKSSKYHQNSTEMNFDFDYVFMPLQVETDAVAVLRHFDIEDALKEIVSFTQEKGLKLILKKHPYCNSVRIRELLSWALSFKHVIESKSSIHDLIDNSKFVFTANSGVGLEAVMYSKSVVTFGRSDYSQVALECQEVEQLVNYFEKALVSENNDYSSFIYEYLNNYTVSVDDKAAIEKRLEKLRSFGYE